MNLPAYLQTTYDMLNHAYPDTISENEYFALLHILYNDMSDRNLSLVMSQLVHKNTVVIINDIWKSCQMSFDKELLSEVEQKLNNNGFELWKHQD